MDLDSIMAGLLHDVVEDCDVSPEEISKLFGQSVAQIVSEQEGLVYFRSLSLFSPIIFLQRKIIGEKRLSYTI